MPRTLLDYSAYLKLRTAMREVLLVLRAPLPIDTMRTFTPFSDRNFDTDLARAADNALSFPVNFSR